MSNPKIKEIEKIQSILNTKITYFANLNAAENVVAFAEMCKAYAFLEDVRLKNIEQNRL